MVHGRSFSLEDANLLDQVLASLLELKDFVKQIHENYKEFKQQLKEYFEKVNDVDVKSWSVGKNEIEMKDEENTQLLDHVNLMWENDDRYFTKVSRQELPISSLLVHPT